MIDEASFKLIKLNILIAVLNQYAFNIGKNRIFKSILKTRVDPSIQNQPSKSPRK